MKNVLSTLKKPELAEILQIWKSSMPSLDLRQSLEMHTPELAHLSMAPCKRCGGQLNVVFHNSHIVQELVEKVALMKQQYNDLQVSFASKESVHVKHVIEFEDKVEEFKMEVFAYYYYYDYYYDCITYLYLCFLENNIFVVVHMKIHMKMRRKKCCTQSSL